MLHNAKPVRLHFHWPCVNEFSQRNSVRSLRLSGIQCATCFVFVCNHWRWGKRENSQFFSPPGLVDFKAEWSETLITARLMGKLKIGFFIASWMMVGGDNLYELSIWLRRGSQTTTNENFYGFLGLPNFVSVQSFRRWRYLERCRAERLVHWSFPFSLFAPHQHFPLTWNPRATTHFKLATFHFCLAFLFSCPRNSSQFLRARLAPETWYGLWRLSTF